MIVAGLGATQVAADAPPPSVASVSLAQLVGQTIVARMRGTEPSPAFLRRVELGQVGGVCLFSDNYGPAGPARLVATLQAAAKKGGRPPLLIAIDQEGGIVRRLPGAPSLAPPQMDAPLVAEAQGLATARNLSRYGINTDLAPVIDVGRGGFITARSFGPTPSRVASLASAFAKGLARGHVFATAKHYPGLGYAKTTTDMGTVTISATRAQLTADLLPFRAAIAAGVPLIMVATASYPALGSTAPAATSGAIVTGLLRDRLGFRGVIITDALDTAGVARFYSTGEAAVRAIQAGADLVIAAGPTPIDADTASRSAFNTLLGAVESGRLSQAILRRAYQRILRLKATLTSP